MATRILIRRGTANVVPTLESGEPGWDTDKKVLRIGDGSAIPPRIPSTKSLGSFDFTLADWFRFSQIQMEAEGKVDGVDISDLVASTGLVTSINPAAGTITRRTLIGATNQIVVTNGNGVNGNPTIALHDDILEQIGVRGVGYWTTDTRPTPALTDRYGLFGYNTDLKQFEGFIHNRSGPNGAWWQLPLIREGNLVYNWGVDFTSVADIVSWISLRKISGSVRIIFPEGISQFNDAGWNFNNVNATISLEGQSPVWLPINGNDPVYSISGSDGNYRVTYNMTAAPPEGLVVGSYVIIDNNLDGNSGMLRNYTVESNDISDTLTRTTFNLSWEVNPTEIPLNVSYLVGIDFSNGQILARKITGVGPSTFIIDTPFGVPALKSAGVFRRLLGTTASGLANTNTINLSNITVSDWIEPGDFLLVFAGTGPAEWIRVDTVAASSIKMFGTLKTTLANGIVLLMKQSIYQHCGAWKVTHVDQVNNRFTLYNSCFNSPPSKVRLEGMRFYYMPTVIQRNNLVTHFTGDGFGSRIKIKNMMFVPYTEHAISCIQLTNASLSFEGWVGFNGWRQSIAVSNSNINSMIATLAISNSQLEPLPEEELLVYPDPDLDVWPIALWRSDIQANKIILTGGINAPIMVKALSNAWLYRLIASGNFGSALKSHSSNIVCMSNMFTCNGPAVPSLVITRRSIFSAHGINVLGVTQGSSVSTECYFANSDYLISNSILFGNSVPFNTTFASDGQIASSHMGQFNDDELRYIILVSIGSQMRLIGVAITSTSRIFGVYQSSRVWAQNCYSVGNYTRLGDVNANSDLTLNSSKFLDGSAVSNRGIIASGNARISQMNWLGAAPATVAVTGNAVSYISPSYP